MNAHQNSLLFIVIIFISLDNSRIKEQLIILIIQNKKTNKGEKEIV